MNAVFSFGLAALAVLLAEAPACAAGQPRSELVHQSLRLEKPMTDAAFPGGPLDQRRAQGKRGSRASSAIQGLLAVLVLSFVSYFLYTKVGAVLISRHR